MLQRKVTYRMYPNATEDLALDNAHGLYCRVSNSLIEEHKRRYEAKEGSFNFNAMCKAITEWRGTCAALDAMNAQSLQVTAKRIALAFDKFFKNIKEGKTPGFPRFQSRKRFSGWGYKSHGDGWKLLQEHNTFKPTKGYVGTQYGSVRLSGIGTIGLRGKARFAGTPKTCEIMRRKGKWYLSVTFNVEESQFTRKSGSQSMAFDWGIKTLLTEIIGDALAGTVATVDNPRWLKNKLGKIKYLQGMISEQETKAKKLSGKEKKFPVNATLRNLYERLRALHGQIARQRQDFYHKLTTALLGRFGLIVTEELSVKNMSRAPKAKQNEDGRYARNGAAAKAGLNRSILEAAPAGMLAKFRYKAAEVGSKFIETPTRKLKPSQRCCLCGEINKHDLDERTYRCKCGNVMDRDENAPRSMMRYAYEGAWWTRKASTAGTAEVAGACAP